MNRMLPRRGTDSLLISFAFASDQRQQLLEREMEAYIQDELREGYTKVRQSCS
jgi:hypothetical protein